MSWDNPTEKNKSDFNNGVPFVNGNTIQADTFNSLIENTLYANEQLKNIGVNSGGSTKAIVDTNTLPTENINNGVFYRSLDVYSIFNGQKNYISSADGSFATGSFIVVETLPSEMLPFLDYSTAIFTFYYVPTAGTAYGYVDPAMSQMLAIPEGVYDFELLAGGMQLPFGGFIQTEEEAAEPNTIYIVLANNVSYRNNNKWNLLGGEDGYHAIEFEVQGTSTGSEIYELSLPNDVYVELGKMSNSIEYIKEGYAIVKSSTQTTRLQITMRKTGHLFAVGFTPLLTVDGPQLLLVDLSTNSAIISNSVLGEKIRIVYRV